MTVYSTGLPEWIERQRYYIFANPFFPADKTRPSESAANMTDKLDKIARFDLRAHPTPLSKRLLSSKPGSTVNFTLEELLQVAPCGNLIGDRYGPYPKTISTGILAVYHIAAQHETPPVQAVVALLSEQYRSPDWTYREEFACTTCKDRDQLCLRVNPDNFPLADIRCAACAQAGTPCNIDVEELGIERPPTEEDDDEWDGNECEDEEEPSDKESDGSYTYSPNPLPLETLDKVNAILQENHLQYSDSRDWGGGGHCESYELMFRVMTSCRNFFWFQHEDAAKRDTDPDSTTDWIKQLFRCFPEVIRETRGSSNSWSIVIPTKLDGHVFANISFTPPAKSKGKEKAVKSRAAGKKEASVSKQSPPPAHVGTSLKRDASPDATASLPPSKQRRPGKTTSANSNEVIASSSSSSHPPGRSDIHRARLIQLFDNYSAANREHLTEELKRREAALDTRLSSSSLSALEQQDLKDQLLDWLASTMFSLSDQ